MGHGIRLRCRAYSSGARVASIEHWYLLLSAAMLRAIWSQSRLIARWPAVQPSLARSCGHHAWCKRRGHPFCTPSSCHRHASSTFLSLPIRRQWCSHPPGTFRKHHASNRRRVLAQTWCSLPFRRAHCIAATAMLAARSFRCRSSGSGAIAERAEPKGAVFLAEPSSESSCTTVCSREGSPIFLLILLTQNPRNFA